ncbi:ABC transporter ATP-binding protein [Sneathiella litorea]|uniref:ATP-binding cassette domain-containing protein n=1 Tax=Sneathiella litorea TaxID=2606216 RepID=A0A6L8W328_9PROT|nr:ABC transporter ATP-binding protein [Sneathiella litorea]MZR29398.1 ATP-binding cassette domain-containing protein [Sneathiella litorea]
MTNVSIENLVKLYPGRSVPAVKDVSLLIETGSLTALLGPSACGKSTILKMIAGLLAPTSGDIRFGDHSILRLPPEKRDAVMVFQDHLLFPYMTVAENIGFGLKMRRRPKAEISHAVGTMLELVKLDGMATRKPNQLSGGQQQRIALARALILRPKILLLDEPFSSLDANLRLEMQQLLKSLHQEMGMTMLFVTHDQEEAVALSSKIALILDGTLRQYADAATLYGQPEDLDVAKFFGAKNFIPGISSSGHFECALGRLTLPVTANSNGSMLTFRPENVVIGVTDSAENSFHATIESKKFLGNQTQLRLSKGGTTFDASLPPLIAAPLLEGSTVSVHLPRQSLWALP